MQYRCDSLGGDKGVVCGPVDTHPADGCLLNKTQDMPRVPTKSCACSLTPWPMGNVNTAKSWKGGERVPDALKWRFVTYGRKP
jgi:hypothetical protein